MDEYLSEMEQILAKLPPDYCGSCYGAENPERECCNTCSELMTAYREKGWSSEKIYQDSEQVYSFSFILLFAFILFFSFCFLGSV